MGENTARAITEVHRGPDTLSLGRARTEPDGQRRHTRVRICGESLRIRMLVTLSLRITITHPSEMRARQGTEDTKPSSGWRCNTILRLPRANGTLRKRAEVASRRGTEKSVDAEKVLELHDVIAPHTKGE